MSVGAKRPPSSLCATAPSVGVGAVDVGNICGQINHKAVMMTTATTRRQPSPLFWSVENCPGENDMVLSALVLVVG
jgi:hypothetical protein